MIRPLVVLLPLLAACTQSGVSLSPGDGYERALAQLDLNLASTLDRIEAQPTDWTIRAEAAGVYRQRARLSGDWSDYAASEAQLAQAFEPAGPGSGPFMTQAGLHLTLHRLAESETAVARAEQRINLDDPTRASVALSRARIDLLTDGYDDAAQHIALAISLQDSVGAHSDAGRLAWVTGDFDRAHAEYDRAESMYHGISDEPRAWFHLQRGLMDLDRGRYDEALAHYLDADAALPGYWLVHEHIAEVLWAKGDLSGADTLYADVVARTGAPDLQDTYAEFLMERGEDDRASELLAAADTTWQTRLEQFPDAAYGHALGHYLRTDPQRAVDIARAQVQSQPSAASRTALAQALLNTGELDEARVTIDAAMATAWRHADTYAIASRVYAQLGLDDATALCDSAHAINPDADCG